MMGEVLIAVGNDPEGGCGFCIASRRRKLFIARAENVW